MRVVFPGRPVPKARPRPGARGRYYVPSQPEQNALALFMARYRGKFTAKDRLAITCEFHFAKGARPGDGDNLQKLVWDAAQDAGVFANDMQIEEWHGRIIRGAPRDQTVIEISRID